MKVKEKTPQGKTIVKDIKRFPPTEEGRASAKAYAEATPGAEMENAAVTGTSLAEATYGAKGVLVYEVDATAADAKGVVIERLAELRDADLIWPVGITTSNQNAGIAELLALNIKLRAVSTKVTTLST